MNTLVANFKVKIQSRTGRFLIYLVLAVFLVSVTFCVTTLYYNSQLHVFYSLDEQKNDEQVIAVIDNADQYVYFAIYFFTKDNIAEALIRAKKRGLIVWGIVDREASADSNKHIVEKLRSAGVTVETQKHRDGIMHIKALVTEKAYVSGSYNWTASATNVNDEVLEVGTNKELHDAYFMILKKILILNQ
jgi:phosphatidylserine/phosphatidylglycerophosphate/cardiolipin synthase-like enzyme